MESSEDNAKFSAVKKKFRALLIDPNHLNANEVTLISHLYESTRENSEEITDSSEFIARGKLFKRVYKVTYRDPNNHHQMIEQPVKFTQNLRAYPVTEIDPDLLEKSDIECLLYIHTHHTDTDHFRAKERYVSGIPDQIKSGKLLQRPVVFKKDVIIQHPIEINPTELTNETKKLLALLIQHNPQESFFDAIDMLNQAPKKYLVSLPHTDNPDLPIYQIILLTHSLLRFTRKETKDSVSNEKHRYAVYHPKPIAEGSEGVCYKSGETLKLIELDENKGEVIYKKKSQEKLRFIKVLRPVRDENGELKKLNDGGMFDPRTENQKTLREWGFLNKLSIFAVKSPILTEDNTRGALITKFIQGRNFMECLLEDIGEFDKHEKHIPSTGNIFTVDQRLDISIMFGEAILDQVHCHNIVHRDLKPENVILKLDAHNNPLSLTIVDFGLAKWVDEENLNECCGSIDYAPPEAIANQKTNEKSDGFYFAKILKTILWQALSNQRYDALSEQHRLQIRKILSAGTEPKISDRATIDEMVSVFKEIRNQRNNKIDRTLHM